MAVLQKLLEMHQLPPCEDMEEGESCLMKFVRQKYESFSQFEKVLDEAFEQVVEVSNAGSMQAMEVPASGILRFVASLRDRLAKSEHDKYKF